MVRNSPITYNKQHLDFKNAVLKDKAWKAIGEKCKITGKIDINNHSATFPLIELIFTGQLAKKRFKSLREKYSREKRRQQVASKSGAAASSLEIWIYTESLKFLDPFMTPRSTTSNDIFGVGSQDDDASFDQSDDEETGTSTATMDAPASGDDTEVYLAKPAKRAAPTIQPVTMQLIKEQLNTKLRDYNPQNKQKDHATFLAFLCEQLDHMTPDQLIRAKQQILDVTFRILMNK